MLTRTLERGTGRVVVAIAVFAGLTGLANAQQSGLFPLHPIKRQRVPCPNEDPVYATYRNQYFGYYPTQWRPFPQGWSIAGPETPNVAAEFQRVPMQAVAPAEDDREPGRDAPDGGGAKPTVPTPPAEDVRSPFEMDSPDSSTPPRRPANPRPTPGTTPTPTPGTTPTPAPGTLDSPFDTPSNKPPGTNPPPATPGPKPPAANPHASRSRRNDRDEETLPARVASRGPILEAPDATLPDVEEPGQAGNDPAVLGGPGASAPVAQPAAQPPASRRGRLSSLFSGWIRR